jgi:DNA-binding transcriptional ArsR family regulator
MPAAPGPGAQEVLSALASPIRREILSLIWEGELSAGEIAAAFELSKPTISGHLAVLRRAGLVKVEVAGNFRHYRAQKDALDPVRSLLGETFRWTPVLGLPEQELARATTLPVVVASVDVETDPETTFAAFNDERLYSRWLGVPVRLRNGRFSCTMEWGTRVLGRYLLVHPPELIVMSWDFEDDNAPLPGREMTGYLRVTKARRGSHVEVHQLVADASQAEFMEVAWTVVLGRLKAGVVAASDRDAKPTPRPARGKHSDIP